MSLLGRLVATSIAATSVCFGIGPNRPDTRPVADPGARVEVPFEMLPSNHMVVEVLLNGEGPYRLIFDVGSPVTLIGNKAAKESGIIDANVPFAFLFTAKGEAEVDSIRVGELTAEDLPVIVMDHPVVKALGEILGKPIDGLVGHSFFARYKTTIDYQAKTMTFEPVKHEIRDFLNELPDRLMGPKVARRIVLEPAALFGLMLEDNPEDGSTGVTVAAVLEESPASDAGLQTGDVITALDGRWTTDVADAYAAASKVKPGVELTIELRRGDQKMSITLEPRNGI